MTSPYQIPNPIGNGKKVPHFTTSDGQFNGQNQTYSIDHVSDDEIHAVAGTEEYHGHGSAGTHVNVEQMDYFVKNVRNLAELLENTNASLAKEHVGIKPGLFATAQDMANKVSGPGGLSESLSKEILNVVAHLKDICNAVDRARKDYAHADKINKMSADEYNEYFGSLSAG